MTPTRCTRATVDLTGLERNWRRLVTLHAQGRVMTVLKANAYGHGLLPVARFLQGLGQRLFGVALLDEALALRGAGIEGRILVLGPPEPGSLPVYARSGIEATVPSLVHLREALAVAAAPGAPSLAVHLKCDTGMGRIGLREDERDAAVALLRKAGPLHLQGVYSHLADAEELGSDFCNEQLARFERWSAEVGQALSGRPLERHLANSAGLLRDPRLHFDFARVGFALWAPPVFEPAGSAPAAAGELEQPLTLRTRVSLVKSMHAGESVGYGRTYRCREGEVIATLPIGYGDGYFRNLSNRGQVILRGERRPVVGRVSMDQITVSLGTDACAVGDEAILLGGGPGGPSAAEVAAWAGTSDYEVFTNVGARVPRDYVHNGHPLRDT